MWKFQDVQTLVGQGHVQTQALPLKGEGGEGGQSLKTSRLAGTVMA